ncbi:hypothetical protein NQ317_019919 [Molorchus minor]|uniref:Uncharacterized protein n=1 Tax=Molorchus minor TaxID=1323400 RepID=A0ABQ9K4L1_9CUCU|nr:hypothetical protein NQ317_019919 [Molorchus minor]
MVIKCLICKAPFKQGENRSFHRLGFASSGNSNDSSEKTLLLAFLNSLAGDKICQGHHTGLVPVRIAGDRAE